MASIFTDDLAIDLGTSYTRIHSHRRGALVNEPTALTRDLLTGQIRAVGREALQMVGRTSEYTEAVRPVRGGLIADFEATEALLAHLLARTEKGFGFKRPRVVLAIPAEMTQIDIRAMREAVLSAGARRVYLVHATMAAALGAGNRVKQPAGHVVVDIGAGTTEVALMSLSGEVYSRSMGAAICGLDEALREYFKREYNLIVPDVSIERLKRELSATELEPRKFGVRGYERNEGTPRTLEIDEGEIQDVIKPPLDEILASITQVMVEAPPELCAEVATHPVLLCGGGAMLAGLARRIQSEFNMRVLVADNPLEAVVRGCRVCLEELETRSDVSRRRLSANAPIATSYAV